MKSLSVFIKLFLLFSLITCSGCQTINVRGQYIDDKVIKQINTNLTKKDVLNLIGTPTYDPEYSNNTWYYIQRSQARRAWFTPKVIEQRILKIQFDENERVTSAELIENSQDKTVKATSKFTKVHGTEQNAVQKFIKNAGRFNPTKNTSKRKRQKKKKK
ncbi:MAG: outer membrane protein assembly factor BamE [Rickettsiaceae bacterium]|nr:outer membrane protein assembly factor BamE [Rickettsiaceae bacterium]